LSLAFLLGCGTEIPPEPPSAGTPVTPVTPDASVPAPTPDVAASQAAEPSPPTEAPSAPAVQPLPPSPPPTLAPATGPELAPPAQATPAAVPGPAPAADMERVKAEKGVGVKGRSLDEHEGVLVTPAKAYFSVRERAVFEMQIPQALKLFKATNGNGPKTHEEFMAQIIDANQIQLPELPAGQRYVYDPEKEELQVERPAR
jgi:hypothetical protein